MPVRNKRICRRVILLLVFVIYTDSLYASMLLDKVVAIVNKEVITWSELYKSMEFEAISEVKALSEAERRKVFKENETFFIEGLIDKKLQLQAAKALDIDASKEEVTEAVESVKKKYAMSDKDFEGALKKEGLTIEEYKKNLAEQIILSKVVGQQVRNKLVISDEEIKDYMAGNKDASYRVRQIFFKKTEKGPDRNALEAKANEVFKRLKNGESFSLLAAQFSDDPSGKAGGDLGNIKKEHLGKEFLEALSNMNAGDISRPFWTDRGIHIIKLEEKVDTANLDELKEIMKRKLFEQKFNEAYKNWVRSLREKAYIEVKL